MLLVRYYVNHNQLHKIQLLCGSIAVTIATHKNSKINVYLDFI